MRDVVFEFFIVFLIKLDFKVNSILRMVLPQAYNLRITLIHYFIKILFVILCPFADRKLLDMHYTIPILVELYYSLYFIL